MVADRDQSDGDFDGLGDICDRNPTDPRDTGDLTRSRSHSGMSRSESSSWGRRGATIVALVLPMILSGCARFGEMARRMDQIPLPHDYELLAESQSGTGLGLFGAIPRMRREYRSPRGFEETCEEIRIAVADFTGSQPHVQRYRSSRVERCIAPFRLDRFSGGVTAVSPIMSENVDRVGSEAQRDFVRVDVQLVQH